MKKFLINTVSIIALSGAIMGIGNYFYNKIFEKDTVTTAHFNERIDSLQMQIDNLQMTCNIINSKSDKTIHKLDSIKDDVKLLRIGQEISYLETEKILLKLNIQENHISYKKKIKSFLMKIK